MARLARGDVFDPFEISTFHCINRCVRRCFLCGHDPVSGKNFNHRKRWLEERLRFLAGIFGIDVRGFAILSTHFHFVLRNRPDVVATWSDQDVALRCLRLCPVRKTDTVRRRNQRSKSSADNLFANEFLSRPASATKRVGQTGKMRQLQKPGSLVIQKSRSRPVSQTRSACLGASLLSRQKFPRPFPVTQA